MVKSGTAPVQERDAAVQPDRAARAVLVSDRHAVWLNPLAPIEEVEQAGASRRGPMPTQWTHDLVHCRLVAVNALTRALPRLAMPSELRSFLTAMQPQEAAPGRRRVLTDADTQLIDWTMTRIWLWSEIDRAVLMGFMTGTKPETISRITFEIAARRGGTGIKRPTVYKRYRQLTTVMAEEWKQVGEPIDNVTRECWLNHDG